MKQVLQSYRTGELKVAEVPAPAVLPGTLLVRTTASLVSAGTERAVTELAQKSLLGKARERPDLVQKVKDKVAKDGLLETASSVLHRLDQPIPLGYSLSGVVVELGRGVQGFSVGQRVACAGAKVASHAELNAVPTALCSAVPDGVSNEAAAFVTLGAIALHGVRQAQLTLGERVCVIGLGLVGQLAAQLCQAQGCPVIGVDLDERKLALARTLGIAEAVRRDEDVEARVLARTGGRGVDAVLICAAGATNDPIELAGKLCRDRGRVVVVGAVGMELPRRPFYDKELTVLQSRSYGPGRYDPVYEEQGIDYPLGYVRWTEGRNLESFLELCAAGKIQVGPLVTHRFPVAEAERAYALVSGAVQEPYLGILLTYPSAGGVPERTIRVAGAAREPRPGAVQLSVIGAGAFTSGVLLPALKKLPGIELKALVSARGVSASHLAGKYGFRESSTDANAAMTGPGADAVLIATRHERHAEQACAALDAGKSVFLEKPAAITREQLDQLGGAVQRSRAILQVDFNRRFAPLSRELAAFFDPAHHPLTLTYRISAGPLLPDSWILDPQVGGGRILGEVCHFIDLCAHLTGSPVTRVWAECVGNARPPFRSDDQLAITLRHQDGSVSTLLYTSGGDSAVPKERLEAHGGGRSAILEDFRELTCFARGRRRRQRTLRKDKGHRAALAAFVEALCRGTPSPTPWPGVLNTSLATLAVVETLGTGQPVEVETSAASGPPGTPQG